MANLWDIILGNKQPNEQAGAHNQPEEEKPLGSHARDEGPREGETLRLYLAAYETSEDVSDMAQLGVEVKPMRVAVRSDLPDCEQVIEILLQIAHQVGQNLLKEEPGNPIGKLATLPMDVMHEFRIRQAAQDQ